MSEQRVSCVVVTGAEELGIVTDRDFRRRVVAQGYWKGWSTPGSAQWMYTEF